MGKSGSGKSASMRNLNPETTFVINVVGKDFPFRSKGYSSVKMDANTPPAEGNVLETDNFSEIMRVMSYVSANRPEIKTLIVDDVQYIYANEYMRRIGEKGYDKYNEIAHKIWSIAMKTTEVREDLIIFLLSHVDETVSMSGDTSIKAKTIGKLVDNIITLEGLFATVLMATTKISKDDGVEYGFVTHGDGTSTVKSPIGMFEEDFIPNDLNLVQTKYIEYYD